ncbi:patatin family protein [Synechococcus sp. CS-1329]|uniref:patatin family protein n=1 Tax=Synechococcus sp. CS-1329 TaxID=2847975 RepID=UPI0028807F10|nr:patatin family protein [Synechococcus sp. CS-1329]MCT0219100.1 patatin family protein [Synechococcus sp. CS-1329]
MTSIGLALGSGGARGWAHIGVLRALQEQGIRIDGIAGSSIGALVGAMHCADELDDLEDFIRELSWKGMLSYFDMVFPTSGLLDGNKIYALLSERLQEMRIEDSDIPFCCVTTDLINGKEVQLRSGLMVDAVRASISVPGIFTPFCAGDRVLADGGLVNPVPVDVVRSMGAEVVIAVNLNSPGTGSEAEPSGEAQGATHRKEAEESGGGPHPRASSEASKQRKESFLKSLAERYENLQDNLQESLQDKVDRWFPDQDPCPNIFEVIGLSLNVMEQQVTRSRLEEHTPDLLVQPLLADFAIFDFHKADAIIRKGYTAMKQQMPALMELL